VGTVSIASEGTGAFPQTGQFTGKSPCRPLGFVTPHGKRCLAPLQFLAGSLHPFVLGIRGGKRARKHLFASTVGITAVSEGLDPLAQGIRFAGETFDFGGLRLCAALCLTQCVTSSGDRRFSLAHRKTRGFRIGFCPGLACFQFLDACTARFHCFCEVADLTLSTQKVWTGPPLRPSGDRSRWDDDLAVLRDYLCPVAPVYLSRNPGRRIQIVRDKDTGKQNQNSGREVVVIVYEISGGTEDSGELPGSFAESVGDILIPQGIQGKECRAATARLI
jgi:hypothetical protein